MNVGGAGAPIGPRVAKEQNSRLSGASEVHCSSRRKIKYPLPFNGAACAAAVADCLGEYERQLAPPSAV
jgi:hypothetical protein